MSDGVNGNAHRIIFLPIYKILLMIRTNNIDIKKYNRSNILYLKLEYVLKLKPLTGMYYEREETFNYYRTDSKKIYDLKEGVYY